MTDHIASKKKKTKKRKKEKSHCCTTCQTPFINAFVPLLPIEFSFHYVKNPTYKNVSKERDKGNLPSFDKKQKSCGSLCEISQ